MTNKVKVRLTITALFLLMAFAFVGSITGTLSWYVYYLRATLSFRGTSVADAEQIQVGIVAPSYIEGNETKYRTIAGLDDPDELHIAWAKPGKGLKEASVQSYLTYAGYAINELIPVTSSAYEDNDTLALTNAPSAGSSYDATDAAMHYKYVYLPLVIRVINVGNTGDNQYAKNKDIWITNFDVAASNALGDSSNINKALRVHTYSSVANFIIRPADDVTPSDADQTYTTCAGLLDLNKDGLYDRVGEDEHMYGEFTGSATSTDTIPDDETRISASNNINGLDEEPTSDEGYNSFWAMHSAGTILKNYAGFTLAKQYHYGFNQIAPERDATNNGRLYEGRPVARTANDTDALAYLTLTVWLEGWDHVVVDEAIGHFFNLGITFEVNNTLN